MITSEKTALYQFLQAIGTSGNSSGWAAFFRNGNSANVPRTFTDLVATSRCAVELKYQQQITEANGTLTRLYSRGRSLMPIPGYGQGRTIFDPTTGKSVQTYAVYPEYSRYVQQAGTNKTPQQVMANIGAAFDYGQSGSASWSAEESVEYDYGRTLRFRSIYFQNASVFNGNIRLEYQDPTTLVWTRIVPATGFVDMNIIARKLRLTMNGTGTTSELPFVPYVEKGSDFVTAAFTHVVLVSLSAANPSATSAYLSQVQDDYYGLVLDVGTDIVLGVPTLGQFGQMCVPDLTIRIADNFVEGV